jgi:hypothetical protein
LPHRIAGQPCGWLHQLCHLRISYNSCRNRHCPKCQGAAREKWIQAREEELLPVPYFHVVFTLPDTLNRLCLYKPKILYDVLFKTSWSVLNSFGHDPKWLGAQTGMISILHTWGQTMSLHPHLHCIVPGGGLTKQGKWKQAKSDGKYLFDAKAMSKTFRGRQHPDKGYESNPLYRAYQEGPSFVIVSLVLFWGLFYFQYLLISFHDPQ